VIVKKADTNKAAIITKKSK